MKCPNWLVALLPCCMLALATSAKEVADEAITCNVSRYYKYRPDGKPAREAFVSYHGKRQYDKVYIEVKAGTTRERTCIVTSQHDSIPVLLPAGVGATHTDTVWISLSVGGKHRISQSVAIPYARQWTVYIYPHSHVDIGYTNTQANVELIHKRNLDYAIELAEKTKDYPEDARFVWNPEVIWPIDRYLKTESKEKCAKLLSAIRKGQIAIEAGYVHTNTSTASEEELFEFLRYAKKLEAQTGRRAQTLVQVDIPGMSWGVVPVAARMGVNYCLALFNGTDRVGLAPDISFKPFWWVSQDGLSKMLFLQPGAYTPGAHNKGYMYWPKMAGQTDPDKLLRVVKTDHPREHFIDKYLEQMLPELEQASYYPYDIFPMTWCMADNTPIDADLPDAVKSWNEEYAFPHLKICTATDIMSAFDQKYGDSLPQLKGDFTEYWTDGLGSAAAYTGHQREVKEHLVQTETLHSMINFGQPAPRNEIEATWRNIIMGTEHTWAYMNPSQQPICDEILNVKLDYFRNAARMQQELAAKTVAGIQQESPVYSVFNTCSWNRSGVVRLPKDKTEGYNTVIDRQTGKAVACQRLTTGELAFVAEDVPSMGCRQYLLTRQKSVRNRVPDAIQDNVLDNGVVRVTLSQETGDVVSMVYGGKEYADARSVCGINSYRYLHGNDNGSKATKAYHVSIKAKERGPVINSLVVESEAEGCRSLRREVTLVAGQAYVSIENTLDKIATTDKEGVHFGFAFDIPRADIYTDQPWSVMQVEKDQLAVANRNWMAFQRWMNVSNKDKNMTLCSLNAGMFEVGAMTANVIGGAYRSPEWLRHLGQSATVYSWALNNHWHTNFPLSQEGIIRFAYRLLPGQGAYDAAAANRFGLEQARPLVAVATSADYRFNKNFDIAADASVTVSVVQTVDNGRTQIIRLRSVSAVPQKAKLLWNRVSPARVMRCADDGQKGADCVEGGEVTVPAMGFVTVRAEW